MTHFQQSLESIATSLKSIEVAVSDIRSHLSHDEAPAVLTDRSPATAHYLGVSSSGRRATHMNFELILDADQFRSFDAARIVFAREAILLRPEQDWIATGDQKNNKMQSGCRLLKKIPHSVRGEHQPFSDRGPITMGLIADDSDWFVIDMTRYPEWKDYGRHFRPLGEYRTLI